MGDRSHHDPSIPRGVLLAAAAMIGFTILAVVAVRIDGGEVLPRLTAAPVSSLDLSFADRGDGTVAVYDVNGDRMLDVLAPAEDGFAMGVLRSIDRERSRQDIATDERLIRMTRWADGRLTLEDPSTGFHAELVSFGPTNLSAFAQLLIEGSESR